MREYVLVFLVAAAVTYLLTVSAREIALRTGAVAAVRDRDVHAEPIPYLGGLAMLVGFILLGQSAGTYRLSALLAAAAGITVGGGALAEAGDHPVQAVADVVVAVVLVVVLPRDGRTRLWAVALTAPLTWVAAQLLDVLRAVLG